ncbi:hypothetical protein DS991_26860, partial [Escherichia coli]
MNGIKTGLGITPGEHIISADSALSRNIRQCFCLSCHGRLILQTDAQGAWFEHDLYALSEQQKAACVVLNPEKSHPYIEDMEMFLSPLPVVLEWHCMMCEQFFHGKKFCEACGTGIYCRVNRPDFPGECFICELRLPDHCFRWKHNELFLLLPEEYGPA